MTFTEKTITRLIIEKTKDELNGQENNMSVFIKTKKILYTVEEIRKLRK